MLPKNLFYQKTFLTRKEFSLKILFYIGTKKCYSTKNFTKKLLHQIFSSSHNHFFTKKNTQTGIVTKLKNSNCDNLKSQAVTKLKKLSCNNLETQIMTKHKSEIVTKLKRQIVTPFNQQRNLKTEIVIKLKN